MSQLQPDLPTSQINFSQMEPDESQAPPEARASEKEKLDRLSTSVKSQVITDLSRLILFKALSGETIDRSKLMKELLANNGTGNGNGNGNGSTSNVTSSIGKDRFINAAIEQANLRLRDIIGLELKLAPKEILENKGMPKKYKDRMYVVNTLQDDDMGTHSKAIHTVHIESAIEKGLLMFVLALIYCKGEVKDHLRWLSSSVMFRLLHSLDDNIPAEPASSLTMTKSGKKRESTSSSSGGGGGGASSSSGGRHGIGTFYSPSASMGASVKFCPNVDEALEKFVHMDYLVKKKFEPDFGATQSTQSDEQLFLYAMGPRSYLEIGKRQVLYFCAEVMDQQPDESMLNELNRNDDDNVEER